MKREKGIIVAIDGPSGAGKSTIARLLAKRLAYLQIDTGAMYRAMAFLARHRGVDLEDILQVEDFSANASVELIPENGLTRVYADGQEVTSLIRTPEISMLTSRISALSPVRGAMTRLQREMGTKGGVVLDGRDIGTVVFPDAEVKFYLSASAEERGRRRFLELKAKGQDVSLEATIQDVLQRDRQDSEREIAPLRMADDAVPVDSTGLTIDEVVSLMESLITKTVSGKDC